MTNPTTKTMKYFAVIYKYDPASADIADVRPAHREFIARAKDEGKIVGSGPFPDAEGGALIVVQLPKDAAVADAEKFISNDPFWQHGLITDRTVREWNPVINIFDTL